MMKPISETNLWLRYAVDLKRKAVYFSKSNFIQMSKSLKFLGLLLLFVGGFVSSSWANPCDLDKPEITAGPPAEICTGGTFEVSAVMGAGTSTYWVYLGDEDGLNDIEVETGAAGENDIVTVEVEAPSTPGIYTVWFTTQCTGSTTQTKDSDKITFIVSPMQVLVNEVIDVPCGSQVNLFATSSGVAPTYTWTSDDPPSILSGGSTSQPTIAPTVDGTTYTVEADDNVCGEADPVTVTVNIVPLSANAGFDKTIACSGNIELHPYNWSNNNDLEDLVVTSGFYNEDCDNDYITSFKTTGGIGNINNSSGCSQNGYSDYTAQELITSNGSSFDFTIGASTLNDDHAFGIWIDWNNDGVFSASELAWNGLITVDLGINSTNGSIAIHPFQMPGNYRMRVRLARAESALGSGNADSNFDYGEIEEYTLKIISDNIGGLNYTWSNNTGANDIDDVNSPTPTVSPLVTTTYTMEISAPGCGTSTDDVKITVENLHLDVVGQNNTFCGLSSMLKTKINGNDPDNVTYHWSPTTDLDDPTASHPISSTQTSTTYTVYVSSPGCANSNTGTININVSDIPVEISADPSSFLCASNDVVTLTATNPQELVNEDFEGAEWFGAQSATMASSWTNGTWSVSNIPSIDYFRYLPTGGNGGGYFRITPWLGGASLTLEELPEGIGRTLNFDYYNQTVGINLLGQIPFGTLVIKIEYFDGFDWFVLDEITSPHSSWSTSTSYALPDEASKIRFTQLSPGGGEGGPLGYGRGGIDNVKVTTNNSYNFEWLPSNLIDGSNTNLTATSEPLAANQTFTLKVTNPEGCETLKTVDITVVPTCFIWEGDVSNVWTDGDNWVGGVVPTATDDAVIPQIAVGNVYPIITGTHEVNDLLIETNNITFYSLQINNGGGLTINGNLDLGGDNIFVANGGILSVKGNVIGSDNVNHISRIIEPTTQYGGSGLVLDGNSSVSLSGNMTIDRLTIDNNGTVTNTGDVRILSVLELANGNYTNNGTTTLASNTNNSAILDDFTGNGNYNGVLNVESAVWTSEGTTATNGNDGYRNISSPVATTVADINNTVPVQGLNGVECWYAYDPYPNVQRFDESYFLQDEGIGLYNEKWLSYTALNNPLNAMQGIAVRIYPEFYSDLHFTYKGIPNTGVKNRTITYTDDSDVSGRGWNFVGNPYPSPIKWSDVKAINPNIEGSYYAFHAEGEFSGTWGTFNGITGTNGATDDIAIGQGFMVLANSTGSFTMNNNVRFNSWNIPYYGYPTYLTDELRLKLTNGKMSDEIVSYSDFGATTGYDSQFDAKKFPTGSDIYISYALEGTEYAINVLDNINENTVLPLVIYVGNTGKYELHKIVDHVDGLTPYLLNTTTGEMIALEDEAIALQLTKETVYTNYSIVFSKSVALAVMDNIDQDAGIVITSTENTILVSRSSNVEATISVTNLLGQTIVSMNTKEQEVEIPLEANQADWIAIVKVQEKEVSKTVKVLIKK